MPMSPRLLRPIASGLDPDVVAFRSASGATDLLAVNALTKYLRTSGLLSETRLFPMKSSQNAGTGSTVYGIGGLTENNMTLINGPSWGAEGIAFSSTSSHYGTVPAINLSAGLWAIARVQQNNTAQSLRGIIGQYATSGNQRSWLLTNTQAAASGLALFTSGNGTTPISTVVGDLQTTTRKTWVARFRANSTVLLYDSLNLAITGHNAPAALHNSSADLLVMSFADANFLPGTLSFAAIIRADLTDAQRTSITNLVDAL